MKKTITTLNRSIPSIQTLLAKATLLFFAVILLSSCEEDVNTVGFKPDRNNFRVRYVEIELPSSVIMPGAVITSNKSGGDTPRLLVGSYVDNKLGKVTAESFIQFRPASPLTVLPYDAKFVSLELRLSPDYYIYGASGVSTANFYVHEISDSLITETSYYNNSVTDYKASPIGSASKTIDPISFNDAYTKNNDIDTTNNVIDPLVIQLNGAMAIELFKLTKERVFVSATYNEKKKKNDTTYTTATNFNNFKKFRRIFKGLAVKSDASNKIIGFNPAYTAGTGNRSQLLLSYNYLDTVKAHTATYNTIVVGKTVFSLYNDGSISYSKISADRTGSSLQSVDELYKPFYPDGDNRFIQSGSPIITKVDFSKFSSYTDTIKNLLINSAEIVIDPDESTDYKMPDNLGFRILNAKNDYLKSTDTIPSLYAGSIVTDANGYMMLGVGTSSGSSISSLTLSQTNNVYSYNVVLTRYFQTLYSITDKTQRLTNYGLVPIAPNSGKSVNRLVFNQNNLKLKLYFTTPVGSEKK